jgi:hypothetical protein
MDIVIYASPETLLHKRTPDMDAWWEIKRPPKKFKERDRVYFAVKGEVKGYFISTEFNPGDYETICWNSDSWIQLDELDVKYFCDPFQGFRYRWFEK